ncbi:MAG: glycosyltransferase family 39 protein [Hyphomonadaceae bacterium]
MNSARRAAFDTATLAFFGVMITLTALRIAALFYHPLDLYFDEAQYWSWSRTLEWGYFTKPPMVAWAIAATTAVFGDPEWAIRLSAPIAHALTATVLFALGRSIYGAWAGFWAGVSWLAIPAVWLASMIISTDTVMLPFWSLALLALWRLVATRSWTWAVVLGLAIGLGIQAKYAMLYFFLCAGVAAWWAKPVREALGGGRAIVAALIALLVFVPNIVWNVQNGFATVQHTAANANFEAGDFFNFDELGDFLTGQIGVIGPVLCILLIGLFWRAGRRMSGLSDQDKFLLAFILPPLLCVTLLAFISRAHANWAVVSYPAALVWIAGEFIVNKSRRRWLAIATAANVLLAVAAGAYVSNPAWSGQNKTMRSMRAWDETAREIALRAVAQPGEAPFTAVLVDDRATFFELAYYWRHARRAGAPLPPVRMWRLHAEARSSADATDPMRPEEGGRVLVVHLTPRYLPLVAGDFTVFRTVEHLTIPLGGGVNRDIEISVGEGFAPVPRDEAFMQRFRDASRREP